MKKVFLLLTVLILLFICSVYGILFTKTGNSYVASFIEEKVNTEQKDIELKINNFTLTFNTFNFTATISDNSHINIAGDLDLLKQYVDLKYSIKIIELSKLQNLIKQRLNGSFKTSGTVKGDTHSLIVKGISDVANSQTSYDTTLLDLKPKNINFLIKNAKIDKLLHLINQPIYASGLLTLNGKIKNPDIKNLDGIITTTVRKGKTITSVINSKFEQNLTKEITFQLDAITSLIPNKAITKTHIETSLANLGIKKAVYSLENGDIKSDYLLFIPSLNNLYDITSTKMRGTLAIKGDIKKENKLLFVDGNSELLGGTLNFDLKNDDLHANLKGIQIKELTHMMYYPHLFDSKTKLTLDYNILKQKGKLTGNLLKGHFLANDFSSTINQLSKFDITREIYDTVDINTDIHKKILSSKVTMKSKNTQIDVTDSVLDLEKSKIDATINSTIKKAQLELNVKGDINDPKISFNSKKILSNQINRQIQKNENKIKEKLNKALKGRLGDDGADKLFKSLKSFF